MASARISLHQSILRHCDLRRRVYPDGERTSVSVVAAVRDRGARACLNLEVKKPPSGPAKSGFEKSKEVMETEAKFLVGTYARSPVVLASGKGCKLYDVEGREYLDLSSGIAVNALGHCDSDWVNAVAEQANILTQEL